MSKRLQVRRCSGDQGQILILALIMLTTVGLVVGAMLAFAETNMLTTPIVKSRADRRYATDAAIEYGIKAIGADASLSASSASQAIPYVEGVNGRAVTLTCQATSNSGLGADGYAAVVDDLNLDAPAGDSRSMNGKLYVQGNIGISGGSFTVNHGSVLQATCPGSQPPGIVGRSLAALLVAMHDGSSSRPTAFVAAEAAECPAVDPYEWLSRALSRHLQLDRYSPFTQRARLLREWHLLLRGPRKRRCDRFIGRWHASARRSARSPCIRMSNGRSDWGR